MRGSDSLKSSFVRKVRDVSLVVNWLFAMLVGEEGC